MRPLPLYMLIPLTAIAATAIPIDPARAAATHCPRAVVVIPAQKAVHQPARVETKKAPRKLEAL